MEGGRGGGREGGSERGREGGRGWREGGREGEREGGREGGEGGGRVGRDDCYAYSNTPYSRYQSLPSKPRFLEWSVIQKATEQ